MELLVLAVCIGVWCLLPVGSAVMKYGLVHPWGHLFGGSFLQYSVVFIEAVMSLVDLVEVPCVPAPCVTQHGLPRVVQDCHFVVVGSLVEISALWVPFAPSDVSTSPIYVTSH